MITTKALLHLLLHNYSDGRYLNGHPEIAEFLSTQCSSECYVEVVDTLEHVRVWSSEDAWKKSKVVPPSPYAKKNLESQLREQLMLAMEKEDFTTVSKLNKELKELKK